MNISHACFSPCQRYRYSLLRDLGMQTPALTVVMLNPSTADAVKDDPTIRRVIGFAKAVEAPVVPAGEVEKYAKRCFPLYNKPQRRDQGLLAQGARGRRLVVGQGKPKSGTQQEP